MQARLGATVRTYRQQLGITQEELAWRADMHRTYLADIERGARNITLRSIANLAHALQLSVEGLLFHARGASDLLAHADTTRNLGEILIIEDNAQDSELTMRAFRHARIANPVTVLGDGAEALEYLFQTGRHARRAAGLPQLVLLDLGLPNVPGVEVLRQMRAHRQTRDIPVVVLTASRHDTSILECSRLGAADYIVKPLEFTSFANVTSRLEFNWTLRPPGKVGPHL